MPVPPEVGSQVRDDDEVADAGLDLFLAAGAQVRLASLVRLDRVDRHRIGQPKKPHSTRTMTMTMKPTTMATSAGVFLWERKGLKPTAPAW